MIKKMMVAYDGSATAKGAFQYALDLAKHYNAQIHVLSVVRLPEPPEEVETKAVLESGTEHYKEQFTQLRHQAKAVGLTLEAHVVSGHPAEQILHWAHEHQVDTIVMGHQTRSTLGRWLLGSQTDRVVDHAQCNVIVVKHDRHASPE
jgi:nucleotide-binding universal stress UspA family protein